MAEKAADPSRAGAQNYGQLFAQLQNPAGAIKIYCEVGRNGHRSPGVLVRTAWLDRGTEDRGLATGDPQRKRS